jgi:hypothetical protein
MWRLFGELLLHTNSQIISYIGNFLNKHGGLGGADKKLKEFFIHRVLKT